MRPSCGARGLLCRAREHGLGFLQCRGCGSLVAGGDRLFHFARVAACAAAARFVGFSAADGLAGSFLRRFGIGHWQVLNVEPFRHRPIPESAEESGIISPVYSERPCNRQLEPTTPARLTGGSADGSCGLARQGKAGGGVERQSHAHFGHRRRRLHRLSHGGPAARPRRRGRRARQSERLLRCRSERGAARAARSRATAFTSSRPTSPTGKSSRRLFAEERPERVIHLAAQAGVRYSLQHPHAYIDANIVGFLHVLEGCRHHGVRASRLRLVELGLWRATRKMPFSASATMSIIR